MINWKFIEEHMEEGYFRCTTTEQADEFLKACEEHKVTWNAGIKATEYRAWEGTIRNIGYVRFLFRDGSILFGGELNTRGVKTFEYKDFNIPMKDVFISGLDRMLDIYKELCKVERSGMCRGRLCNECAMLSDTEACGFHCRWNQLNELIVEIKRIAEEHTWTDEKPAVKELTVNEISKLLGYEVKVVKED